ncbi:MAG: hypothetical protein RI883_2578 [Bacteroidota bacterium]
MKLTLTATANKMKSALIVSASLFLFASCGNTEKTAAISPDTESKELPATQKADKVSNALAFINDYVANSNNMANAKNIIDWANSNQLSSEAFKTALKEIIDAAFKEDAEMGLDSDPIYDAQDYPEKGFELASFDEKTNYLIVKGIGWFDFKITMKVVEENGKWLVDGCGIVNIPEEKRMER